MDIVTTAEGWQFLLRWLHFLAGITWIGVLYYFNFIQTPFLSTDLGGQARSAMTRGLVPNALWWFRWGAMFTFLSGWAIVIWRWHLGFSLGEDYMTRILTGGVMGSVMWYNVWFVIWPIQKKVIASAEAVAAGGEADAEAAQLAPRAGNASRTNTLLSIPMLFFMGSASHVTFLHTGSNDIVYWILALIVIGAVELNALAAPGRATQNPLKTVSGTIHAGLGVTLVLYVIGWLVNS